MNKFWVVIYHTFLSRIRTKSFIISTIITMILVGVLTNAQTIFGQFSQQDTKEVIVIDKGDKYITGLKEATTSTEINYIQIENKTESEVLTEIQNEKYDGLLILSQNNEQMPVATFKANNIADISWVSTIENALQQVKIKQATEKLGLDQKQVAEIYEPVKFEAIAIEEGAKTEEELNQARGIVYFLLFVIYMAVLVYGTMIATEVATEKSSRVMEILVSSVSPAVQMFGKIFGIALLGVTQFVLILGTALISTLIVKDTNQQAVDSFLSFIQVEELPISIIIYALIFFLLGFLLYGTIMAMLGSLVNKVEEVNQMITPVMMFVIAAFLLAMYGLSSPEAPIITITSYIPLFTPMIMFLRIGLLPIPVWEIALGIGILVASIILIGWFGAKIYRGGVLMYGMSSSIKNIKAALKITREN